MSKKVFDIKKIIVTFIIIYTITITLLSMGFIISYANHDCIGNHCSTCIQIKDCLNVLSYTTGICCSAITIFNFYKLKIINRLIIEHFSKRKTTPVGLRVRMNN